MVGKSGATLGGRERIVIVDELLPGRLKRAARRHVLRRQQLWRSVLVISVTFLVVTAVPAFADRDARALTAAMLSFPVCVVLAGAAVMGSMMLTVRRHIDTEFVAGRLMGLTVGSHTIRYRDHDSCVEYDYACVGEIEEHGDVVVIAVGSGFWVLPIEMFDGVSLEVLRTRASRRAHHGAASPEPAR